jgi:hypothetical protein
MARSDNENAQVGISHLANSDEPVSQAPRRRPTRPC